MTSLRLIALVLTLLASAAAECGGSVDQLVREVRAEKDAVVKQEIQRRNLLGELYSVNKELKKINSDRGRIEQGFKRAAENVHSLTTLISQLDSKLARQRVRLRARMKSMSKVTGQGVGQMILGSRNSGELDANLKLFRIVTERDFRLLKNYKGNLKILGAQKSRLSQQEKKYASFKRELDKKEKALASRLEEKNRMLKTVDSSRILHMAKLKKLKLESQSGVKANAEIAKIQALEALFEEQLFEKRGALRRPTQGPVVRSFGIEEDPDTSTRIRFKGQLFGTQSGAPVATVFKGVVEFRGWLQGYGQTVIVNHGDNYFSVYSNLEETLVRPGDRVASGQKIGIVDSAETFLGHGLYFELRHFSEPIDPSTWWESSRDKAAGGGKI